MSLEQPGACFEMFQDADGSPRCASPQQREQGAAARRQQPRQIDPIILSTFISSGSVAGLVPSAGPFMGPWPVPDDESAVPEELVPGAAALAPEAPPVTDIWCDPPRANAAVVGTLTQRATQRTESFFMPGLPRTRDHNRRLIADAYASPDAGSFATRRYR